MDEHTRKAIMKIKSDIRQFQYDQPWLKTYLDMVLDIIDKRLEEAEHERDM